jgi:hypothetical protein
METSPLESTSSNANSDFNYSEKDSLHYKIDKISNVYYFIGCKKFEVIKSQVCGLYIIRRGLIAESVHCNFLVLGCCKQSIKHQLIFFVDFVSKNLHGLDSILSRYLTRPP